MDSTYGQEGFNLEDSLKQIQKPLQITMKYPEILYSYYPLSPNMIGTIFHIWSATTVL